jgi:2-polyprenyl-3-methyl-5-hydroxy-6-metoxy-1,4-benzoquinol methylase
MNESFYFGRNRNEMLSFLPDNFSNVLEIGCGQGEFGRLVKRNHDIKYTGIEYDPKSASIAEQYLDLVLSGDVFEQLPNLPENSYDLIICNDVLEHIAVPEILLQNLKGKMKPDSRLVCSIPNFRVLNNLMHILLSKDFEYDEWGIRDKTHVRFFTRKSILRLFKDNGFVIEKIEGINPIKTFKTNILLGVLGLFGHGDIRYHQFGVVAKK